MSTCKEEPKTDPGAATPASAVQPDQPIPIPVFQKNLELLYDYTKFHIGVYITLTSAYLTAASANLAGKPLLVLNTDLVWPAIALFMIAGLAGGVIVSSITQFTGGSSQDFLKSCIGPWDIQVLKAKGKRWTYIEHTSFWLGLIVAAASFLFKP